jgi:hypothetical protein
VPSRIGVAQEQVRGVAGQNALAQTSLPPGMTVMRLRQTGQLSSRSVIR